MFCVCVCGCVGVDVSRCGLCGLCLCVCVCLSVFVCVFLVLKGYPQSEKHFWIMSSANSTSGDDQVVAFWTVMEASVDAESL